MTAHKTAAFLNVDTKSAHTHQRASKPYPRTSKNEDEPPCGATPKNLKKNTPKTPQKGICFRQLAMPVLLASSVNALSVFCNSLKLKTLQNSFPTDWERFPYRLGTCFSGFNLQLGNFNLLTFIFCRIFVIFAPEINKTKEYETRTTTDCRPPRTHQPRPA